MTDKIIPTPEELRKLLRYEPDTGKLFWRPREAGLFSSNGRAIRWNTIYSGAEAFTSYNSSGYRHGKIFGKLYRAHRVAWAIVTGDWPDNEIDHINGDRTDNRMNNLRAATRAENARNSGIRSDNTSGHKGVRWINTRRKWGARIRISGSNKHLGYFESYEAACASYSWAVEKYFGEFGRGS